MTSLEIVLLIIGIAVVTFSYIISERVSEKKELNIETDIVKSSEEEILELNKKVKKILDEKSENIIIKTDDQLSQISNEKIIAINEFSEQILEKIEQNHKEVVFLYNMLSEKEKELKNGLNKIAREKADKVENNIQITEEKSSDKKSVSEKKDMIKKTKTVNKPGQIKKMQDTINIRDNENIPISEGKTVDTFGENNNEQILKLHSEGKSQLEISKLLGLGQGEVKLVLDLFRGVKK